MANLRVADHRPLNMQRGERLYIAIRVVFNKELMSLIWQRGAHHLEALDWTLLRNALCVSQWTSMCYKVTLTFLSRTQKTTLNLHK